MKTKTSCSWAFALAMILPATPRVSNAQFVSPCYPVADTAQSELAVSSAFDGTNFLVGIRGHTSGPDAVGAQLLSTAGNRVGGFINTGRLMDGFFDGPQVAFGGGQFLLIWTDAASQHPASGNDIHAQFISPGGALVGDEFPASEAPGDQAARGAAYDGTNFLVIWSAADGLRGRWISPNGTPLGAELLFTSEDVQEAAAVAFGAGQYLVVWVEGYDGAHATKGCLVPPLGQPGPVLSLSQTNSYFYNPVSVAYGRDRFMVVWHHNADENADWNLRGRMVLPSGDFATDEFPLTSSPIDDFAWANNVVFDGAQFFAAWTQAESPVATNSVVGGQYWNSNGTSVGVPFSIDNTARSKFGLGLSGADGRLLAVVDTGLLTPEADVCARTVSRPTVSMNSVGASSFQINFTGILQCSTNLSTWADCDPQPESPWTLSATEGRMYFRTR